MTIDLSKLQFGPVAAERDDPAALQAYFVASESFMRLKNGTKTVALGNRGSGKTAIFKMIAEQSRRKGDVVLELSPDEYSYELLSQTMASEDSGSWAKQSAYAAAWKYLVYVLVMKSVTNAKGLKTEASKKIYRYLRDNHDNTDVNPLGILISRLKRLEGIKIGRYEASVKARELERLYKLEEINQLLDSLENICSERNVVVLIDELDRGWDASEDAKAFVAGLFQAATAIPLRTPSIRVLISLRRELYESIPSLYEDAQKVRDIIEVIEWDEPNLLQLISQRIVHSFTELSPLEADQVWEAIFSQTLDYRKTKSFNYIVDRTLYRPREILQFCIDVRNYMIEEDERPPATYQHITEAEHSYSQERTKDIAAEYRFQFPGLLSVLETFRGLSYAFTREEIEFHCLQLATAERRITPEAFEWCENLDPDTLIEALWQVGFLRALAVGGVKARRRSGSSYIGSHQVSSLSLNNVQRFHVHPMFRAHLALKEPKASK